MFENYPKPLKREQKNADLLAKYQKDIDKLSEIFTEDDLLHLMTQEQPDGTRKMRPSLAAIEIFAPSALLSNYINFFQYTDYLEKWCVLQCEEFKVLAINIYGHDSIKQNKIPDKTLKEIDAFLKNLLNKAPNDPTHPIFTLLNILDTLVDEKTYQSNKPYIWNGKFSMHIHNKALKISRRKIITYIKSSDFTNSLPKISNLEAQDAALLFFARFCDEFYFHFLLQILDKMKNSGLIKDNCLNHPAMFQLITLAMLPHEVMQHFINEKDTAITLTSPDRFVIDETIPRNKENLTGIQKNINQILYKTYIYIALLIFPEWKPTAKEIILFLEGKSKTVKGLLDLKSTALGLPSKINDVGRLSKNEYVTRLLSLAQTK
ncbi:MULTISPECIES: hypothetical protein [Enterobacter cloacae complex]|uniref:hypothetical protein n=1 Tax=Enterobacter cloacae complex TaxID=354276 RepID=UPI000F9054AD|nr:hypothetical protein [Enterobacter kobei]EDU9759159.1 hypothetical protein [Salmonella enterica]MIG95992.1 hypothetical protein [Salmonella enterica]